MKNAQNIRLFNAYRKVINRMTRFPRMYFKRKIKFKFKDLL